MSELPEDDKNDQIITVRLPRSDYIVLREMIDNQNALSGVRKWFHKKLSILFWIAGGLLTMAGLFEFFRRFP